MSKLDELIAELCPDGVEYASIGSLIKRIRERGKDDISVQQVYVVSNSLGIVRAEDYRDNTIHSEDTSNYTIIRKNMFAYNPSRLNIGSIAMLKEEEPGLVSPMYVVFSIDETQIVKEYFEYVLKSPYVMNKINSYKEEGARFRFNFDRWDWIRIPLPPLPVQQEIVRILDNFTELTAELTARRKQYEYYRDLLLTFDDDVPMKPLSEVCVLSAGGDVPKRHFSKEKTNEYKVPIYSNGIGDNALYGWTNEARINNPCITIAARGTIGYVALRNEPFVPVVRLICAIPKECINVRYLKYATETLNFKVPTSGIPQLTVPMIGKYNIPVPPLEEQERIVAILDRFDALCNDLTSGIPA